MKFPLLTSLLSLMALLACNAQQSSTTAVSGKAEISINMQGAAPGTAYLIGTYAENRFRVDSAQVDAAGQLTFSNNEPYPAGLYYAFYADQTAIQFLLDEDQEFSLSTTKADLNGSMQVEGSLSNQLLYEGLVFETNMQPRFDDVNARLSAQSAGTAGYDAVKAEQTALIAERQNFLNNIFNQHPNNFFVKFKRAGQNPTIRTELTLPDGSPDNEKQVYFYRQEFWDNVDFTDSNLIRTPVIANKLTSYITRLTPKNADSIIASADFLMSKVMNAPVYYQFFANWITLQYEPGNTDLMDGEAVYAHMINRYFTPEKAIWTDTMTIYGLRQRADEMSHSLVGQNGPNISVPDANGQAQTLYDETAPYLIVFMYNPTCDHCIAETPQLKQFAQGRPDVKVYGIAIDTDREAWLKFVQDYGLQSWTNVFDPTNRSIYKTYYVDTTPELYLLNPERVIIGKNLKTSQVAQVIERDRSNR